MRHTRLVVILAPVVKSFGVEAVLLARQAFRPFASLKGDITLAKGTVGLRGTGLHVHTA